MNKLFYVLIVFLVLITVGSASAALTDGLVTCLNADTDLNSSTGTYNATWSGVARHNTTIFKTGTGAIHLDGNNYITWGNVQILPDPFTFAVWIYDTSEDGSDDTTQPGLTKHGAAPFNAAPFSYRYSSDDDGQKITAYAGSGTGGTQSAVGPNSALGNAVGSWTLLVVVKNGNSYKWYGNTTLRGEDTDAVAYVDEAAKSLNYGYRQDGTWGYAKTIIDTPAIWNKALSEAEITELYNAGAGLPCSMSSTPVISYFSITATTNFNSSAISIFNATLTDGVSTLFYSTINGTITTSVLSNSTSLWNITVQAGNHWNGTRTAYNVSSNLAIALNQYPFITLTDYYDNTQLSAFSAVIGTTTYSTTNTQLFIPVNASTSLTFSKDTYLPRTDTLNLTANSNRNASIWQYQLNVTVADILTGTLVSYNFTIPLFTSGGNASSALPVRVKTGTYTANITSAGYASRSYTFTATAASSANVEIQMAPYVNFTLLKESNGAAFLVNTTQQTILNIVCEDTTIEYTFNTSTASIAVNCSWNFMKLDVVYNTSSYFRTLVPASSERLISWYLLDLTADQAVQIIIQLNDLTGQFYGGYATIKKVMSGTEQDITVQYWDIENRVTTYLMTNGLYTLSITAPDGTVRSIGYLIADAAGTKTITVPTIQFIPEQGVGDLITWDWNNQGDAIIRLQYNDTTAVLTSPLVFMVFNGTNTNQVLYTTTLNNVSYASLSYSINTSLSYLACFNATNPSYGLQSECRVYEGITSMWDSSDFDAVTADKIKGWASIILIVAIFMTMAAMGAVLAGLATVTIFMWIFMHWGWLTFGTVWMDYTILSLVAAFTILDFFWRRSQSR